MQVITISAAAAAAVNDSATLLAATDHKLLNADAERLGVILSVDVADAWVSLGTSVAAVRKGFAVRAGGVPLLLTGWPGEMHVISSGAAVVAYAELKASVGDGQGERPAGADAFVPSGPSDTAIPAPTAPPPGTPIE